MRQTTDAIPGAQSGEITERVILGALRQVEFRTVQSANRLTIRVVALDNPDESPYLVQASLRPDPVILSPCKQMHWGLWAGIPASAQIGSCPFYGAVHRARELLFDKEGCSPISTERQEQLLAETMAAGVAAAKKAVSLCDPKARKRATRFAPNARWFVYSHIVADKSGRLAQLADSCPGAFIFALALKHYGVDAFEPDGDACDRLLREAVAGLPLNRVLDNAIEAWLRDAPYFENSYDHAAWDLVRSRSAAELARLRLHQRLLIRRAVPGVKTELLWLPPPTGFIPEDMPKGARAMARWFRFAKAHSCYRIAKFAPDGLGPVLSSFASAHAEPLAKFSRDRGRSPSNLMADLADYVISNGVTLPSRTSDPTSLLAEMEAWEQRPVRGICRTFGPAPTALPDDTIFPPPPIDALKVGRVDLSSLRTPAELEQEGDAMEHCVGTYAEEANSGQRVYYGGKIGRTRVTVELIANASRWRLGQTRGRANRDVKPGDAGALVDWLKELNRVAARPPKPAGPHQDMPF